MLKSLNANSNNKNHQQKGIDVSKLDKIVCNCGNDTFKQQIKLRRLSPMHPQNPTHQEQIVQLSTIVCDSCGAEFDPNGNKLPNK